MRALQARMALAKIVLHELSKQPLCRTRLENQTVKQEGTHATFEGIFRFLVQSGYVQKSGDNHRDPYIITEKGTKFLEAI